ncbi:MAG: His/Gly/Thr/Pro-type tRNA ligase C-terminal domain-containing protein, partial [Clostridia bacterium]|nr:His/Gly/Thr/Pro-type tRNA ligase C-terminal domain-containing protein [Clostridia bacterium]
KAFTLVTKLRECGVPADCDLCGRSFKAQMKYANKIGADFTIVLGDTELEENKAVLKNMKGGENKEISLGDTFIDEYLSNAIDLEEILL